MIAEFLLGGFQKGKSRSAPFLWRKARVDGVVREVAQLDDEVRFVRVHGVGECFDFLPLRR